MNELAYNIFEKNKFPDNLKLVDSKLDQPKVVATWGTYDCLHDGHKEFLLKASRLGKLFVIVVPSFAKVFNKEYKPHKTALERRADLIEFGKVHNNIFQDVLIDCYQFGLKSLILLKPDVFVFGYDQDTIWDRLLPQFLSCFGLKPEFVKFPKTDVLMHNGENGNFIRLESKTYQELLIRKRAFFSKPSTFEYQIPHLESSTNPPILMKHPDEIR